MLSEHQRGPSRRPADHLVPAALACVLGLTAVGCQDPSRMFEGTWESVEALPEAPWIEGRPELSIGHFGTELTGVVRYLDDDGLPTLDCACAFIDHQRIDLDAGRFVAVTRQCDASLWIWDLTLTELGDDLLLEGTVEPATDGPEPMPLTLRLIDRFVPEDRRECVQ